MNGMKISEFLDRIYYGDEIEFKIGSTTYFAEGTKLGDKYYLTVDYWQSTDGTEPRHDYLFSIECDSARERAEKFEEAKIFGGKTIREAQDEITVLYG